MTVSTRWIAIVATGLLVVSAPAFTEPLTLDSAIDLAQEASQSLERSRLEMDVARAELTQARAALLPKIGTDLGLAYVGNPSEGLTVPAGAFAVLVDPNTFEPVLIPEAPVEVFPAQENLGISVTLALDQPIFTSGKLRAGVDAAVAGVEVSAAQREARVRELRRQVTLAYTAVVAGRESVVIVEEIVRVLADRVADAEQRFAAGATTRGEVLSEQSRYASARLQLVRTRQGLATAEANLAWLLGAESGSLEILEAPAELPVELPPEDELVSRARLEHPMLEELRTTANRAAFGVEGAIAASVLRPDIGLRVKAEVIGQAVPFFEDDWRDSWDANLTVSIGTSATIFDGLSSGARRDAAEARLAQARSAVAEFSESLPLRVRASLERYLVAQAMLAEARAQLDASEEQARVVRVSFENELVTRSDVLGARLGVLQARLSAIGARTEGASALAEIEYLAGAVR